MKACALLLLLLVAVAVSPAGSAPVEKRFLFDIIFDIFEGLKEILRLGLHEIEHKFNLIKDTLGTVAFTLSSVLGRLHKSLLGNESAKECMTYCLDHPDKIFETQLPQKKIRKLCEYSCAAFVKEQKNGHNYDD